MKFVFLWILRLSASIILLQTLYFKFSAHPESVELFSKLGMEPWGRIGTGVLELLCGALLLITRTVFLGALLGCALMLGAIVSHLTLLGIESKGDGGQLFALAIGVFMACLVLLLFYKEQSKKLRNTFKN